MRGKSKRDTSDEKRNITFLKRYPHLLLAVEIIYLAPSADGSTGKKG